MLLILIFSSILLTGLFAYALNKTNEANVIIETFLKEVKSNNSANTYKLLSPKFVENIHKSCSIPIQSKVRIDPKLYCLNKFVAENNLDRVKVEKVKIFGFTEIIPWNNQVNLGRTAAFKGSFKLESSKVVKEVKFILIKNQSNEWVIDEILFEN